MVVHALITLASDITLFACLVSVEHTYQTQGRKNTWIKRVVCTVHPSVLSSRCSYPIYHLFVFVLVPDDLILFTVSLCLFFEVHILLLVPASSVHGCCSWMLRFGPGCVTPIHLSAFSYCVLQWSSSFLLPSISYSRWFHPGWRVLSSLPTTGAFLPEMEAVAFTTLGNCMSLTSNLQMETISLVPMKLSKCLSYITEKTMGFASDTDWQLLRSSLRSSHYLDWFSFTACFIVQSRKICPPRRLQLKDKSVVMFWDGIWNME